MLILIAARSQAEIIPITSYLEVVNECALLD